MGQALYRKHRSRSFADVVGQDHITKTLQNAIKSGRISHAYLFTGPRGVGKTSVARILAHEINNLPYTGETIHLDIIEIDAASNRRIDEIRDLRDRVRIAPASAKYKVYIIDEVHMLTREAFNALLKTLEEPPAHCVFILATTESHKLPETIISRTQRFEFRPVTAAQAASHLETIAKQEKIKINKEALHLLAEFGNGSFRDSISYLDQLSSYDKLITAEDVRQMLGLPADQEVTALLESIQNGVIAAVMTKLKEIEQHGITPSAISAALSGKLRQTALSGHIEAWQLKLLKQLVNLSSAARQQEALEIIVLDAASANSSHQSAKSPQPDKSRPSSAQTAPPKPPKPRQATGFDLNLWDELVEHSKKEAASIYTALRLAQPRFSDGVLVLAFQFPLHQKKLAQAKNKLLVSQIIKRLSGADVIIEPVIERRPQPAETSPPAADMSPVSSISSIFGNAEVIEA
jgi:DNA polymerase III subunit gamma/tau